MHDPAVIRGTPAPGAPALPLTVAQRQFWAGQKLRPETPLYNMAFSFRIAGPVDPARFARAFAQFLDEADALRMVVLETDLDPVQSQGSGIGPDIEIRDVSACADPAAAAQDWMAADARKGFDLARRSFRTALLKLGAADWIWYFNQHHIFCDASSFAVMFARVSELYAEPASPPRLTPFSDFVSIHGEASDSAWFDARTKTFAHPLYGRSPATPGTHSVRVPVPFGPEESHALQALAAHPDWRALSPQMSRYQIILTVLLAFQSRVTGQTAQSVGAPVHNRPSRAFKNACGAFVEVLPMVVEVAPDDTFRTLFEKVREEAAGFLRHARPGMSRLSQQRSFNTVLNYITAQFGDFAGMKMTPGWIHTDHCDAHHHLRLQVEDFASRDRLSLHLDLNTAVFDDGARDRAVHHFRTLLTACLRDPDGIIEAVDILSTDETRALDELGAGPRAAPKIANVADAVLAQCRATPDAPALSQDGETVSYAALADKVDRLARQLRGAGVRKGDRIALMMPRCIAVVVAMLATMRAGAAFAPVDPAAPADRIALLLADMKPRMILAPDAHATPLGADLAITVLTPSGDALAEMPMAPDLPALTPGDTAYILYTSGSSGTPKGVVIPHRGLAHYIGWARDTYASDSRLTFPLFTPLTFDLTVTSIFLPLVTGGQVRVYPATDGPVDLALFDVLEENCANIIKLTPSHMGLMKGRDLIATRLRQMIVGGEDFPVDLAREIHEAGGSRITMHNEYGPTEATVGCVHHVFDPLSDLAGSVPIGRPIANIRTAVLNAHGQPVPPGVPGELHIAGPGIAEGYLDRPALTAASFYVEADGTACYRTGDLVRHRPDGGLDYLGRMDDQIKVNGVRIEPGEIAARLKAYPGISDAVVAASARATAPAADLLTYCVRCGLPSNFPDVQFDDAGQCQLCAGFDRYRDRAQLYFKDMSTLRAVFDDGIRPGAPYDCLALFSGGKDSTYMLARLVEMGLHVLAFTLDNGFLSDGAKANIARVTGTLGVEHVYGTTPHMDTIFADSLTRHANVCHGCFKTIYTLSLQMAHERGIPFVVTGLSRGQFFETRLTPDLFEGAQAQLDDIDATVLRARKSYHRLDDAVSRCMDVSAFRTDEIFDRVEVVDFYRYCDVDLDELYAYLDARLPWVRPTDTGRSTNCLINDVGIHVHKRERGYHNYALPYSWDVRMGHKNRDAALEELMDDIDADYVASVLARIGYKQGTADTVQEMLVGYYVAARPLDEADVARHLSAGLPDYMVPTRLVWLKNLPLSANGKVDRKALPHPPSERPESAPDYRAPVTETEKRLAAIWAGVLRLEKVGVEDDFFDLGGDSITAIQIVARANAAGFALRPADLFDNATVAGLARRAESAQLIADQSTQSGEIGLLPIQHWALTEWDGTPRPQIPSVSQVCRILTDRPVSRSTLERALVHVFHHHDGLRLRLRRENDRWRALITGQTDLFRVEETAAEVEISGLVGDMNAGLDLMDGCCLAVGILQRDDRQELVFVAHHMVMDALSWPVLLDDLFASLAAVEAGGKPVLPLKTTSVATLSEVLRADATARRGTAACETWTAATAYAPLFSTGEERNSETSRSHVIPRDETGALLTLAADLGITVQDVLLAALADGLARVTECAGFSVLLEGHGRDLPLDKASLGRTVAWMTDLYPVALRASHTCPDRRAHLKATADAVQAAASLWPRYGTLRQIGAVADGAREPDILFNYLGDSDALLPPNRNLHLAAPLALVRGAGEPLRHALEISAFLEDGRIGLRIDARDGDLDRVSVEKVMAGLCAALADMASLGPSPTETKAKASPDALSKLARILKAKDAKG